MNRPIAMTVASPLGALALVARDGVLTSVSLPGQRHAPEPPRGARRDDEWFAPVVAQLEAYFDGSRQSFELPIAPEGTEFQRRVWAGLCEIPYGETASYRDLAIAVGSPSACRAVGLANGRNPLAIVVPCHRVIGADGSLTGYGGGLEAKRWLLEHERAHRD